MTKRLRQTVGIILFLNMLFALSPAISFGQYNPLVSSGNSYVDLSKKSTGGFVQVGDTLEIRTCYFWGSTYNSANASTLYSVRYFDSVPVKTTMATGTKDSLRLITNEGLTFRRYTLTSSDDAATYTANPGAGNYQIRINIGATPSKPSNTAADSLSDITGSSTIKIGTYKPDLWGGVLLTTSFKVVVSGNPGDTIILGTGKLLYRKTSGGSDTTINATPYKIYISTATASTLCTNALGSNLAGEKTGTFDSGSTQNRSYNLSFPIPDYNYVITNSSTAIGDGSYGIVNNTSPTGSTATNSYYSPTCPGTPANLSCNNRMFGGFWDIIGDHTGTTNSTGNGPTTPGAKGGYMLIVNADYPTSQAYNQTVSGLCPNTYYQFSAWVRNICKNCGVDSNSTQTYKPGVLPTLSFSINGLDIYTTGQLDTVGWQQKGFIFETGAGETSATIAIRNNAPGGGGNDWALDDIAMGTCGPASVLKYNPYVLGCSVGVDISLADTIRYSYNPNYSAYIWQESTDGGVTWVNTTTSGTLTPTLVNGYYQYVTNYPTFWATGADSGTLYRVKVASSVANLSSTTCSFTDGNSTMLKIITCNTTLKSNQVLFKGQLMPGNKGLLNWDVSSETGYTQYELEKSEDGNHFSVIDTETPLNDNQAADYSFTDPQTIEGMAYYRVKVYDKSGIFKYTNTIVLSPSLSFKVQSIINPFSDNISANIILPTDGQVDFMLHDAYGRLVKSEKMLLNKGLNNTVLTGLGAESNGIYILTIQYNNNVAEEKLVKMK